MKGFIGSNVKYCSQPLKNPHKIVFFLSSLHHSHELKHEQLVLFNPPLANRLWMREYAAAVAA